MQGRRTVSAYVVGEMKKLLNSPDTYVDDMLGGLCAAYPSLVREDGRVVRAVDAPRKGKVGIVSGGGSGHLPLFTGYVGRGMIDSCAIGDVFAGPTVDACMTAIRAADGGKGVLRLYGNYGGDRMNFDLAGEMLENDGIETATVLGTDDIASASPAERDKRRGVAGLIYAYKIAGAKAAGDASLEEVTRVARKAVDHTRTIGVALSSCQIPGAAAPSFVLAPDEIEMGMGIHGEPGIWRDAIKPADAVADEMTERVLAECPAGVKSVSVLLNSLGATPLEELFILYRRVAARLRDAKIQITQPLIGHWATSMEMAGVSLSLLFLDDELERLLLAPANCPFWRV